MVEPWKVGRSGVRISNKAKPILDLSGPILSSVKNSNLLQGKKFLANENKLSKITILPKKILYK